MTLTAFGSSTAVAAPRLSIMRRRLAFGSLTKIFDAPIALQINMTSAPIGPAPVTSTVLPPVTFARSTP